MGAVKIGITGAAKVQIGVLRRGGKENGDRTVWQRAKAGKVHGLLISAETGLGVAAVFNLISVFLDRFGELHPGNRRNKILLREENQHHTQKHSGKHSRNADGFEIFSFLAAANRLAESLRKHRKDSGQQGKRIRRRVCQNEAGADADHQGQRHRRRSSPTANREAAKIDFQDRKAKNCRADSLHFHGLLRDKIPEKAVTQGKGGGENAPKVAEALNQLRAVQKAQNQQGPQDQQRIRLIPLLLAEKQGEQKQ